MVRVAPDGKLSLSDLIQDWTKSGGANASHRIQCLANKGLLPHRNKVYLGGRPSHTVTADEWDEIRLHLPYREHMYMHAPPSELYVMQYSTIWDCIKIGRTSDITKRLRQLEASQNFRLVVVASFPDHGHLERAVHRRLSAYRSAEGASNEWFNVPAQYAIKIINALIGQNRPESLSSSESEL